MQRRTVLWIALAVAFATACDRSGAAQGGAAGGRASTASPPVRDARFSSSDLPRILLHADEAPKGTRSDASLAHASDVESFARDVAERSALLNDGFESGYVVYFP